MIAGLILAAGESSRMGRDKALLHYRGRSFLEITCSCLKTSGVAPVIVVLGHHAESIQAAVPPGVCVIVNQDYRQGQTSSLQAGLRALAAEPSEAIVLCLVDHPAVSPEVVQALLDAFRQSHATVVVPTYGGRRGHPIVIARELFAELAALRTGQGADSVIRQHRQAAQFVEVDEAGILMDVDDPETYRRLGQQNYV